MREIKLISFAWHSAHVQHTGMHVYGHRNSKPKFSFWWQAKQVVVFCGSAVNQTCPHIGDSNQLVFWDRKEHIQLLPAISQNSDKNIQLLLTYNSSHFICNDTKSVSSYQ